MMDIMNYKHSESHSKRLAMPAPLSLRRWLQTIFFVVICLIMVFAITGLSQAQKSAEKTDLKSDGKSSGTYTLAEAYLYKMADNKKKRRKKIGKTLIGSGIVLATPGIVFLLKSDGSDFIPVYEIFGTVLTISGGVSIISGAILLGKTSYAENKWREIKDITDEVYREQAARTSLRAVAVDARNKRVIFSLIKGAAALAILSRKDNNKSLMTIAGTIGGSAFFSLLIKSQEERAWENFQDASSRSHPVTVGFGILPQGGGMVTARIGI